MTFNPKLILGGLKVTFKPVRRPNGEPDDLGVHPTTCLEDHLHPLAVDHLQPLNGAAGQVSLYKLFPGDLAIPALSQKAKTNHSYNSKSNELLPLLLVLVIHASFATPRCS